MICNFRSPTCQALVLEIGETVQILEKSEGESPLLLLLVNDIRRVEGPDYFIMYYQLFYIILNILLLFIIILTIIIIVLLFLLF